MQLNLPGLEKGFDIIAVDESTDFQIQPKGKTFKIVPGTYLLLAGKTSSSYSPDQPWKNGLLNEFFAP